jgi:hypothetical protein
VILDGKAMIAVLKNHIDAQVINVVDMVYARKI